MGSTKEFVNGLWVYRVKCWFNKETIVIDFTTNYRDVDYKLVGNTYMENNNILGDRFLCECVEINRYKYSIVATYASSNELNEEEIISIKKSLKDEVIKCLYVERNTINRYCSEIKSLEF